MVVTILKIEFLWIRLFTFGQILWVYQKGTVRGVRHYQHLLWWLSSLAKRGALKQIIKWLSVSQLAWIMVHLLWSPHGLTAFQNWHKLKSRRYSPIKHIFKLNRNDKNSQYVLMAKWKNQLLKKFIRSLNYIFIALVMQLMRPW